jgi:signal transduction histidine kinase
MSITIDVTDSIQYQKQIEEQNQDLNDFAYMVSHDLKAPIFTIQGMADALKEDYGNVIGDDGRKLLDYITNAASRLTMLVESVLEYSALTNSDDTLSDVSLEDLIPNVISDYSEKLKNIDSKIQLVNQLPFIKGEPVRIYQLFSNLIGNAIKYRKLDKTLEILISSSNISPGYAQIDISDNGIGIHENKLEDIFRPYRRAQSRDTEGEDIEGSGIGLACVKKIVDKIGGRVSVSSKLNKGSTFSLILPLSKPSERKIPKDLERLF